MDYEMALKVVQNESDELMAERIVELYEVIDSFDKRIKQLEKDKNGGYQSPGDQVLGGVCR